jgi:arylsulfatase A-like enzyme
VRRPGATIVDRFLDWQGSIGDKRFFGFLNLFDAHDPYVEPPGWTPKYTPRRSGMDTYDSAIAYMDAQLGRLFDALRETGVLDRTIVVVTSDHGEQFGGHGLILHGNSLYMRSIHVPLIIRTPHSEATGVVVQSPVSLSALPATLLDLAWLDEASIPGQSLRATWQGSTPLDSSHAHSWIEQHPWGRPNEPATAGSMTSLVDSTHHWIRHASGKTELYAYREDTLELNDRATDSSTVAIRKAFEERFRSARRP